MDERKRTFDTPIREPWNPIIHQLLRAVDEHNRLYFLHRNPWHLEKAAQLRSYVCQLKTYIHNQERKL